MPIIRRSMAAVLVLLAFLAAWLAVEGGTTIWQAIAGKGPHGAWTWIDGLLSLAAGLPKMPPGWRVRLDTTLSAPPMEAVRLARAWCDDALGLIS